MIPIRLSLKSVSVTAKRASTVFGVLAVAIASQAGAQTIRATVNGDLVNFPDVQPMMVGNHVMVPVRGVFEHMNTTLNWDEPTQTIFAMHGADSIKLTLNTRNAVVNGRTVPLDSPAMMYQGRTMHRSRCHRPGRSGAG